MSVLPPDVSGSRARPGAVDVPRPLCECHGEPMWRQTPGWRCGVTGVQRQRERREQKRGAPSPGRGARLDRGALPQRIDHEGRPSCRCHGEPMWRNGRKGFECAVRGRERRRDPAVRVRDRRAANAARRARRRTDEGRARGKAELRRRRARRAGAEVVDFDNGRHRDALLAEYGDRCVYCGSRWPDLTLDHDEPLAWGGDHTWRNLVPACVSCNSSKSDRVDGAGFVLQMLPRLFDRADERATMKRRRPAPERKEPR